MDNKSSAQDNQNPINKSTPKDELGKLKKIRRALYRREEDTIRQSRQKRNDRFNILTRSLPPTRVDELDISLRQSMLHASSDRKKWLYLAAAALVTIIIVGAIIGVFFNRRLTSVSENQIGLTIKGPLAITAGDTINIAIELGNFSHIDWESVELLVTLPDGFTLISSEPTLNDEGRQKTLLVGRLAKRATKTVTLSGRAIGALNTNLVTHAELIITPENFPGGRFSKTSEIITIIDNAPVELNVNIPGETKSGQTVIADITVKNTGADDIENAYVKLTPGAGVQLNQTDPQFSPEFNFFKSEWLVANLNSGDEVVMRAVFFANGLPGDTRSLTVELGIIQDQTRFLQISQESLLKIAATQLSISQSYNGSKTQLVATAGEKIEGLVDFVNTGSTLQQDIEINLKIEGHAFDPTTLDLSVGHFEAATNTIKWTAKDVAELAHLARGEKGSVNFSFNVRETQQFPLQGKDAAKPLIILTATFNEENLAEQSETTISSSRFIIPISSDITLSADAFYDSGQFDIKSQGPLPPEVGDTTSYTVRVRVGSTLNDIGEVRTVVKLPSNITYTKKTYKTDGEIEFRPDHNEVVWTLPIIPALAGRIAPEPELRFQVSVAPQETDRGTAPMLVEKISATAIDQFTDVEINNESAEQISTETAKPEQGTIR